MAAFWTDRQTTSTGAFATWKSGGFTSSGYTNFPPCPQGWAQELYKWNSFQPTLSVMLLLFLAVIHHNDKMEMFALPT